ncbi:MAG: rhomboid family protein [Kiritimatiellaeota bacterium]|nr:rhomboid family protein [Kiritimatiellota bacterium]
MSLRRERCILHPDREAAACCPSCRRPFCRECVTEHDGRLLCAACIGRLAAAREERPRARPLAVLARRGGKALALAASALALVAFYLLVALLLGSIPHRFHDSSAIERFAAGEAGD